MKIADYFKILRPKHWVKNLLIFAPLLFAGAFNGHSISQTFVGYISVCLCASIIYIFNDIIDYNSDRTNPLKQNHPIANGKVKKKNAIILSIALFIADIIICAFLPLWFNVTIGIYFIFNLLYIFILKNFVIIDVLCLSISFILRLYAGGYTAEVEVTKWILVTVFFLVLFLGFAKRRGEVLQDSEGLIKRKVASIYTINTLDKFIVSTGMMSVICYAIFTLDTSVIAKFQAPHLFYSIIFPVYGVFKYILLIPRLEDTDPTNIIYTDKSLLLCLVLWLIATLSIIQFHL